MSGERLGELAPAQRAKDQESQIHLPRPFQRTSNDVHTVLFHHQAPDDGQPLRCPGACPTAIPAAWWCSRVGERRRGDALSRRVAGCWSRPACNFRAGRQWLRGDRRRANHFVIGDVAMMIQRDVIVMAAAPQPRAGRGEQTALAVTSLAPFPVLVVPLMERVVRPDSAGRSRRAMASVSRPRRFQW